MIELIELMAVIASGTFGVMLARRKQMDFVGVFSVAFIAAFGGGTLRDVLLDRRPLFWIEREHLAIVVFGLALAMSLVPRWPRRIEGWLHLPDALGLGLFSIVGAQYALDAGTSFFIASLFGVITGTFGGVIGDVICNEVPNLFRAKTPLYATCSFVGCWIFMLVEKATVPATFAIWAGVVTIVAVRLIALRWNVRLPASRLVEAN